MRFRPETSSAGPALFLDRDGVIIEDTRFLARAEDIARPARRRRRHRPLQSSGNSGRLVSNQSGIARGFYDWRGFHDVQAALSTSLEQAGGRLDAVLACAHYAEGQAPFNVADHDWRKPNPGMILAAGRQMKVDLPRSWIVGDRASDLAAGRNAGLRGGVLVPAAGREGERIGAVELATDHFIVEFAASLADAVASAFIAARPGQKRVLTVCRSRRSGEGSAARIKPGIGVRG